MEKLLPSKEPARDSWQGPGKDSVGKAPARVWPFYIWRTNKKLKIEEI